MYFIINRYNHSMNLTSIETLDLPELQVYRTLRGNLFDRDNSFIADSPRVVLMLLKRGIVPKSILATEQFYEENREAIERYAGGAILYVGTKELLGAIVGRNIHHHVMMHSHRPANVPLEELGDRIVMLERLNNMENIGAIARSAAALGLDGYVVPRSGPHPYGRRAVRVSTGHVSRLDVHLYDDSVETIRALQARGYWVYVAEVTERSIPLSQLRDIPQKWVIVLGNEEEGVSPEVVAACDAMVQIEMDLEVKSFNVSVAGAIVMHWMVVH
jgi:tRNA G18 (ribose-2'-O)-methylase SpoU